MRVLHININYINKDKTSWHDILPSLLKQYDIDSIIFAPTSLEIQDRTINGYTITNNVVVSKCFIKNDRYFYRNKQKKIFTSLEKKINVNNFSCINAYTLFSDGGIAYRLFKKYDIPYVVSIRNTDVNTFLRYRVDLRNYGMKILKNASAIIFLSSSSKDVVYRNYLTKINIDDIIKKTFIIPNGLDNFWLKNINTVHNKSAKRIIKIIYVGAINKNKNIIVTKKALNYLEEKGYKTELTIIGNICNDKVFKKIMKNSNIKYYPFMKKEDLINQYRGNDVFVMPSLKETFGLVYIEAMSQGLPVIYTKGQGFDNQFPNGKIGFAVDPNSPVEIAKRIESIMDNYSEISANAISGAQEFDWQKISKRYLDIFKDIIVKKDK